ncbi:MAG: hypothetical protein P1Q69_03485 [Candidatus Thorarchaeota archaeon]|nr:hypothetical protein [Candidatus Thorarchaeota archaeon]
MANPKPTTRHILTIVNIIKITMPHFGLIAEGLPPDGEALLRAKLHMRGGDIRRERGEAADAIASYYDAFSSAMKRHLLSEKLKMKFNLPDVMDISDDEVLFEVLKENGVIDDSFSREDFDRITCLLDAAIEGREEDMKTDIILLAFENVMYQLGVVPIIPGELPEEDAVTL